MAAAGENGNGATGAAIVPPVPELPEVPTVDLSLPERIASFKQELLAYLGELVPPGEPPWDIATFEGYGRGLVATRDIAVNELVFVDRPVLVGPRVNNYEVIFCASCCSILRRLQLCTGGCRLPICSRCDYSVGAGSPHAAECALIQSWQPKDAGRYSKNILYALTSIRGFLLSERDRSIVLQMEGHPPRKEMTTEIERLLKDGYFWNLDGEGPAVRYLRQVVNILNTNAFETSRIVADEENNQHEIILRGLYILGALMNHCCRPNVRYVFDGELRMRVHASRPIKKGEQIMNNYSKILWGSQHRIIHLCFSKNFLCCCDRCKDPTVSVRFLAAAAHFSHSPHLPGKTNRVPTISHVRASINLVPRDGLRDPSDPCPVHWCCALFPGYI
uniref:SET domain-containing protein n=1 Tax=Anopheles melas TaxID=34690 RepID=A0A182UC74_9DIPT